jgi:hypothetical protein
MRGEGKKWRERERKAKKKRRVLESSDKQEIKEKELTNKGISERE